MSRLSFAHLFGGRSHEPAIALAEKIKELSPAPASKVFFTNSGGEANDTQVKLQWIYNNALRAAAEEEDHLAPARLPWLERRHRPASPASRPTTRASTCRWRASCSPTARTHWRGAEPGETPEDYATRLARKLQDLILAEGPDTIAAFIAEPVIGAGGVIVPPPTYFEKVQAVLERYDIAFIADEVITGFGRLGTMFGSQALGIRPDTVSLAKAITSGYVPMGAVTVTEPVYEALVAESGKIGLFGHGFTYSGHPLACAVALKAIEIYERDDIVGHVQRVAPVFQTRLRALADHPLVGEARGLGLIGAVELVQDKAAKQSFDPSIGLGAKAVAFAAEEGLLCRAVGGDSIGLCPPLVINGAEINELFDALQRALDRAHAWARSEGHID